MRDYQKSRMYRWEDRVVGPRDASTRIDQATAQHVLNYVWEQEGLKYPPRLEALPDRVKTVVGTGSRFAIRLKFPTYTWILLHEIAHTLSGTVDVQGDGHGPEYVGIYIKLISKYLNIPLPLLMYTANEAGLDFNLEARYALLD